jgi:prepilin-type N-terminal cleavage/methylation domain-containing protein
MPDCFEKFGGKEGRGASKGFTLIELMIVIAIIGILAAIAIPNFLNYRRKAQIAQAASDIKNFEKGFIAYALDEYEFPDDSGTYNWEGADSYPYIGISILDATAPQKDLELLDSMLDDGDLTQGKFRQTPNGRHTYIIEE